MEMASKRNSIATGIENLFMIILLKNKIFKYQNLEKYKPSHSSLFGNE
jgi:hypothetical protein